MADPLTFGSLFAGIGGFDLGLERAGMSAAWQVEKEPWCRHILNRHWPYVPCHDDIRDVKGVDLAPVDVVCGGFPCQDISSAGQGVGIGGARSSLWKEYARLVDELRPRYVVVENVAALRRRGLDVVLGDLSALGYDAEWDCLRASDFGAPHRRDRIWIVAYPNGEGLEVGGGVSGDACPQLATVERSGTAPPRVFYPTLANPNSSTRNGTGPPSETLPESEAIERLGRRSSGAGSTWTTEPDMGRVANGVPSRVDRLRGLGNALVPQIAEWIGQRIVAYEKASRG